MSTSYKVYVVIFLLCCFYIIFPVPVILEPLFWIHMQFTWILTFGSTFICITTILNNVVLIKTLWNRRNVFGSVNFLFIMMSIGDLGYPIFKLPFLVIYSWLMHKPLNNINLELLFNSSNVFTSVHYFLVGISITSFVLACSVRTYTILFKTTDRIDFKSKFTIGCFPIFIGFFLFIINQKFTDQKEWSNLVISVSVAYLPITISILILGIMCWYRFIQKYMDRKQLNYLSFNAILLLYVVTWVPMFTVSSINLYRQQIDLHHYSKLTYTFQILFLLKSPLNLLVFLQCDQRLYDQVTISSRRRRGFGQGNVDEEIFCIGSEMKEFHLSESRIEMYADSYADTKGLIQDESLP